MRMQLYTSLQKFIDDVEADNQIVRDVEGHPELVKCKNQYFEVLNKLEEIKQNLSALEQQKNEIIEEADKIRFGGKKFNEHINSIGEKFWIEDVKVEVRGFMATLTIESKKDYVKITMDTQLYINQPRKQSSRYHIEYDYFERHKETVMNIPEEFKKYEAKLHKVLDYLQKKYQVIWIDDIWTNNKDVNVY
ncbi:hypothetical protein [Bacillus cereus]|uniref:hypothetical protein n=1 Tax=Bacillus cereus TaxID=1396 RepID=UPI000BF2F705|nr:hypothetical protein [Bacillus cereus]PEQ94314.1 hypothetical protein CN477_30625 [Bacillus cereus]